ncbi:prolyl oligopeptidase family serine peptidase [Chitinophaga filiformis]|uniref:alpha/beta hydrolase family protein n=1 Tax=Chitinophaga filiformis TaxID=104663 RepID=UPI001F21C2C6|nr:prolyl oligopeptidase family serine peptidase [Chitinophaga filiformis]MCF6407101.1 prolyl oligopeptidase family serine peptidase [Chitinophaga filiformis]
MKYCIHNYENWLSIKKNRLVLATLLQIFLSGRAYAQQTIASTYKDDVLFKQVLDTSSVHSWENIIEDNGIITDNGLFVAYATAKSNIPFFIPNRTIFKSVNKNWEFKIDNTEGNPSFTANSQFGIYKKSDTLYLIRLGTEKTMFIPDVSNYSLIVNSKKNEQYLLLNKKSKPDALLVTSLNTKPILQYDKVKDYHLPEGGDILFIVFKDAGNYQIKRIDLSSGSEREIWSGSSVPSNLVTYKKGRQLAFKVDSSILFFRNEPWQTRATEIKPGNWSAFRNLILDVPRFFSGSGNLLFISIKSSVLHKQEAHVKPVLLYSYADGEFNLSVKREEPSYLGIFDIKNNKLTRIENEFEKYGGISLDERKIYINHIQGSREEFYWNKKSRHHDYVLSWREGTRFNIENILGGTMSPSGKYVVGQNNYGGDLYLYDLGSGGVRNLTIELPIPLHDDDEQLPILSRSRHLFDYQWIDEEKFIVTWDRYDIWLIDVKGEYKPYNLTNGVGRNNRIVFRFAERDWSDQGRKRILTAFNELTKESGFYELDMSRRDNNLTYLSMGNYLYSGAMGLGSFIKSKDGKSWLLKRASAAASPNYFLTSDFKKFSPISDVYPEKKYYWYTTELINFTTKDGVKTQAILYKPENFDSAEKYPVLFSFYEKETHLLNAYKFPAYTDNYYFNYPMMLSKGYIICVPDIYFKIGEAAHCIVDALEGAADHLAQFSYVDSSRYGAAGGSFGGYGINCLAAFSHKFKALVTISGISDFISAYGNYPGLRDELFELRHGRMGVSLSSDPVKYLKNSPVAFAKDVTTPVLIVTNTEDYNVNVQQSYEWFTSLRREGKTCWMLRYQNATIDHGIHNLDDQRDLYVRMTQFFDYYLKAGPAPKWMTKGISADERGIHAGFEYDSTSESLPAGLKIE